MVSEHEKYPDTSEVEAHNASREFIDRHRSYFYLRESLSKCPSSTQIPSLPSDTMGTSHSLSIRVKSGTRHQPKSILDAELAHF